ncbi:MAG TPA: hypothetical protein VJR22_04285 [Candidatus Nitrosotalea sp.]|nr:hypothetical protein [Nitrososphaerota archaeon]HKU33043.1 hypothetical protein [Candidatus Nitrosotalea sp.]
MQKQALKVVFSNGSYTALAVGVFCGLFVLLSYMSQFIFFAPLFSFYIPQSEVLNFSLIVIVASLSGVVASLSIYRIRLLGESVKKTGGGFLGTLIGAGAGACSCSSLGFATASALGSVGGTATAFLTQYDIPLRLVSIAILGYTYYLAVRGISGKCNITK